MLFLNTGIGVGIFVCGIESILAVTRETRNRGFDQLNAGITSLFRTGTAAIIADVDFQDLNLVSTCVGQSSANACGPAQTAVAVALTAAPTICIGELRGFVGVAAIPAAAATARAFNTDLRRTIGNTAEEHREVAARHTLTERAAAAEQAAPDMQDAVIVGATGSITSAVLVSTTTACNAQNILLSIILVTVLGQTTCADDADSHGSSTAARSALQAPVSVALLHHDPAVTAAVIAALNDDFSVGIGARCAVDIVGRVMRTSTAVDEIERRALFRLDANRGLAAKRSAFGRQTKLVIDAAACTVQSDDILTGIRSSVHRIGFRSAVGFGVDLRRGCTAVLFINVEIHLVHVGLCGRSIIADVVDSIAPEPFPSFLRNRVAALRTVSEALTLVDEFIIRNLFEEVRKALTVRVANLVIDNHSVAGIDTGAVIYAIPRDEVGFHVTQTIRSDNRQVFVVVNRTAVIQSCVDFGNFIPQGRNILCAAICSRNSITLLRSFVRNIGLNGNVVIQNQFSAVRGLADILIQMVFRIAGVHIAVEVVSIGSSSGIGLHIGAIPVLHVLSFSLATEIEVRITVIHRVGSVINVQRHDSVPFRIRTVVQVLGFSRVHCFQLNVAAELIECFAAGHETLFKFSHSAVQFADVANLLANIAVLQCDGITDILELREAAAACHITVQPLNGGSTVFITVIGNLCGINGLVITCCAIGFTTLAQFIRIDSIQRNFLRATAIIRVGSRGCPCKVAVAGIVVIQQQRLSLQWRHLNGRCIDDKVTGTSLCNIVCRGSIGAHGMPGRLIGEDTAEIRAIPIHRCIREFQRDGDVLIECRFTCIHLRITASEGIRNPEIGRIPDTAAQSIVIISFRYITDFVLRGWE